MCLIRVIATHNPPLELEAWKVFVVEPGGGLRSPFFRHDFVRADYPEGVWIDAGGTVHNSEPFYKAGFHALSKRTAAEDFMRDYELHLKRPLVVRKVKLRGVHTSGEEFEGRVYVAQEMLILPEEKEHSDVPDSR